ncbi:ExbD/TolR family protein [Psychroflexus sp. MES1-P1E]|jgi:biopolymer transport protein ExbD|uniref:ExbD/TolR family protein n=1 Tax=Psychroflexus sp. MES1-P1E TaxID=2058320 RepID=UPI000C7D6B70|nr:biopolymer transporter ExbD [Psychroflexus sp. MES1-P1E]PKG43557.1 biopolymer transporter ExbD [Psychroflexus sp. MES1-P1E]
MAKRAAPEVNAGSMADIAFLLLIFFLVTTTIETDSGITRKLPPIDDEQEEPPILKQRNIFVVLVNSNGGLFVEDEIMEFKNLRQATIDFLDNGGGLGDEACDYCQGPGITSSSDNPIKAVVSLQNDRKTQYGRYIAVQNELVAAYNVLRDREANRLYNIDFTEMEDAYNDPEFQGDKDKLKEKIGVIKNLFPQKLSEAEPI